MITRPTNAYWPRPPPRLKPSAALLDPAVVDVKLPVVPDPPRVIIGGVVRGDKAGVAGGGGVGVAVIDPEEAAVLDLDVVALGSGGVYPEGDVPQCELPAGLDGQVPTGEDDLLVGPGEDVTVVDVPVAVDVGLCLALERYHAEHDGEGNQGRQ